MTQSTLSEEAEDVGLEDKEQMGASNCQAYCLLLEAYAGYTGKVDRLLIWKEGSRFLAECRKWIPGWKTQVLSSFAPTIRSSSPGAQSGFFYLGYAGVKRRVG